MKKLITTILLALIVSVGMGQTKDTSDIYERHFRLFKGYLELKDSVTQLHKDIEHYYNYYKQYRALRDSVDSGLYIKPWTLSGTSIGFITKPCRDT